MYTGMIVIIIIFLLISSCFFTNAHRETAVFPSTMVATPYLAVELVGQIFAHTSAPYPDYRNVASRLTDCHTPSD